MMILRVIALLTVILSLTVGPVNADDNVLENDIYSVVNREDTDTFLSMMALGYDVDERDGDGFTPLMMAASMGKARFVSFLLENGANVNKRSYDGITAMHRAAQGGFNEIIDMLAAHGAEINVPDFAGDTPLMYAVKSDRRFAVERLVALGAYINYKNARGENAMMLAEKLRFREIAKFLKLKNKEL